MNHGFARSIMIVDDEPLVVSAVSRIMKSHGITPHPFFDAESALTQLESLPVQVALVDVNLPGSSGIEFLKRARAVRPDLEVIIMTGVTSIGDAVQAMRAGAYDYLAKPFESLDKLVGVVGHAIERSSLIHRNRELERLLSRRDGMTDILGSSPCMQEVFETISAAAETPATVLVTGESGTGKELVARALHRLSRRSSKPFVAINCSAFAESVLDSELFGHQKGAFTGAVANRRGMFEAADDATLFLDEVGDMAPGTQVRLLRALQEGEIKRVGGNDTIKVDVRVVAATNVNLAEAVKAHTFREDLYYRLNVIRIHLPPLRERISDVPMLARHMIQKHAERLGRQVEGISEAALDRLCDWHWPGNIRELENTIVRGLVLCRGERLEAAHLPAEIRVPIAPLSADSITDRLPYTEAKKRSVEAFERRYLTMRLKGSGGNISRAAEAAGMDRSNFKRLCRTFHVLTDDQEISGEGAPVTSPDLRRTGHQRLTSDDV